MRKKEERPDNFNGYPLFNDVEDFELRTRNRGIIMANIMEDNTTDGIVSSRGIKDVTGYYSKVPAHEMQAVYDQCTASMAERKNNTVH